MYEFKEQDAYDFARHVGGQARQHGDELRFSICPYCHGGNQRKDKDTFSINLKSGQFKCLRASCGVTGNMITLSKDFDFSLGSMVDEYYRPKKKYKQFKQFKEPIKPKPEAIKYLESRGISEKVAEEYQITVRVDRPNFLVFPFFDDKGTLVGVKYRKTDYEPNKGEYKEIFEKDSKPILFGMNQCKDFSRLIITEGQMDSLSVAESGISNAVSVPNGAKGFTWLPYCWNWVNNFAEVVIFGDFEKGHITLLDELKKRLKTKIKHVREEDYLDCKDANDILRKYGKEQVRKCVENAVTVLIKQVIDLADVQDVDIFQIPKLKTGIKQVDRLLYGGLPMCGVTLVSGKSGEGKSTLASQILVNAIEQGYKCFAYSGELPNYLFKAWLDFQVAGSRHIIEYQNKWGETQYGISKANKEQITAWYRDKCFLYDNSIVDGEEHESLINVTENIIMQYGVKVVLLDNLMTAIDLEAVSGSDKYEKQSDFMKKLSRIALKHDALIILVAHKRKNNFSTNENDEISGSSDIPNLATVTIAYEKNDELEPYQRLCKISKNRLFGKTETKGYLLEYDQKSKRIYGQGDDLYVDYGWSTNDGFTNDGDETPFED